MGPLMGKQAKNMRALQDIEGVKYCMLNGEGTREYGSGPDDDKRLHLILKAGWDADEAGKKWIMDEAHAIWGEQVQFALKSFAVGHASGGGGGKWGKGDW